MKQRADVGHWKFYSSAECRNICCAADKMYLKVSTFTLPKFLFEQWAVVFSGACNVRGALQETSDTLQLLLMFAVSIQTVLIGVG